MCLGRLHEQTGMAWTYMLINVIQKLLHDQSVIALSLLQHPIFLSDKPKKSQLLAQKM